MGKENDAMLEYLDNNYHFAALFNGCFFGGKEIVRPEDLKEGSESYVEKHSPQNPSRGKTVPRIRDLKKRMSCGRTLRILAVEGQNEINYIMPWRHMNYDSLEYGKQIRDIEAKNRVQKNYRNKAEFLCGLRKEDRLAPTYTICLYHGKEKWDGPRSLKEMMDFGEEDEMWKDLFADYRMNLVCINEITDFSKYPSPLKELFLILSCRGQKERLTNILKTTPTLKELDEETAKVAGLFVGVKNMIKKKTKDGRDTYNMCEALQGMLEDSRTEGWDDAFLKLNSLYKQLKKDNRMEDIIRGIDDAEYQMQLLREYGLLSHKER